MHRLIGSYGDLPLRLFDHDFKESFVSWSELDHIVFVVIDGEDVGDVELSGDKLLMVLDLIEEVREVRVLALLLEGTVSVLIDMIVFMVHLLSPLLIVSIVGHTVHEIGLHEASAIRILKVHIFAHLAECAGVASVTITRFRASIVRSKAIALVKVRIFVWYANCHLTIP